MNLKIYAINLNIKKINYCEFVYQAKPHEYFPKEGFGVRQMSNLNICNAIGNHGPI